MRRTNPLLRNNTANEVLVFSNTGSAPMNQLCPGGAPCSAYVDGLGANIPSWSSSPVSISGYRTFIALWNNSTYLLSPPICTVNLSNGSAPTGQPVDVTWSTTGSLSQTIDYATYTGVIT